MPIPITQKPISVCLLTSSLEFGGAERQVVEMLRNFDSSRVRAIVCSLSANVPLADTLPNRADWLHIVEKHGRFDVTTVFRVARLFQRYKVDVVHAFLFDSEIVARLAARLARVPVVISSERNTDYTRPFLHKAALKLTKPLFDVMVANSNAGKQFNIRTQGLAESRIEVVHNGVDGEHFHPDREAGLAFRTRLGLPPAAPVVGMVGSFKRQKDHATFLRMADRILDTRPDCRFLIAGDVISGSEDSMAYASEIRDLADTLHLGQRCLFIGNQQDILGFYNACDLTVLLSLREGTPNVALESMACGRPVIASDIADNAIIIQNGTVGYIVPTGAWAEAAHHVVCLLREPEALRRMGSAARDHVCREYTPARAAGMLTSIYLARHAASIARQRSSIGRNTPEPRH